MKTKLSLIVPLLLIGCGTNLSLSSNSNPHKSVNQSSIAVQQSRAQNAWDELDGKTVTTPASQYKTTHSVNRSPNITKEVNSMLETADSIPDWFYSPPKSDKYFYGAGEGNSVESSKVSALNFIAGEIQTSVSSKFSKSEGYSNHNGQKDFYRSVKNRTRSEVKKIDFTNIEIMKTVKVNNKLYLLVRIDKLKLFNSLKNRFDVLDSQIDNDIKVSQKYSLLDQLITINKIEPKIQKALSLANILATLNSNFNVVNYSNKYNSYINKKTEILHKLTFSVDSKGLFGQKLVEVLNEKGYKISPNSNIKIKIKKQVRNSVTYGMQIARVTVNIQVVANNKVLNSNSIEVKGVSNTQQQALAKAANNFKKKIVEKGINKLLGFE